MFKSMSADYLKEIETIGFMDYYNKQTTEKTADYFYPISIIEKEEILNTNVYSRYFIKI